MTSLPLSPTPEQIASHAFDLSGIPGEESIAYGHRTTLELMADAVKLDRRQRLARRLASARNYLYEAMMGEYSGDSLRRGERQKDEVELEASLQGFDPLDLITWDHEQGVWRPVID